MLAGLQFSLGVHGGWRGLLAYRAAAISAALRRYRVGSMTFGANGRIGWEYAPHRSLWSAGGYRTAAGQRAAAVDAGYFRAWVIWPRRTT